MDQKGLALVTGGTSGIGEELARLAAKDGYDLLIVADEPEIEAAKMRLSDTGVRIEAVQADLATEEGLKKLLDCLGDRIPALLFANAGRGLGDDFIDQDREEILRVIGTNVTGTVMLAHDIARRMVGVAEGRILFTGSVAGFMPGTYQAVYNATKAFIDSFAIALSHELKGSDVSVTCLMPGPVDTEFFDRAGMEDTPVGEGAKYAPEKVARDGYEALMSGKEQVVSGFQTKIQAALAHVMPAGMTAESHRAMAKPDNEAEF